MAQVVLEKLTRVFEGPRGEAVRAVNELSLHIADKEFLVLVGPSGCGKTTTLRLIAGLEEPTGGSISIGGQPADKLRARDRDIAMVFQNPALYPHKSVYENMAFGLKLRGIPREEIDRRVRDTAEKLGLKDRLAQMPQTLSGGERQRVAVGRAVVRRPAVFLFDEPLSNLDAPLRAKLRGELTRLHRETGSTVVYATHDQMEAMTLGDRIAVLKDGVLQQVAAPMTLYREPANQFVAGFIGWPTMNFFKGEFVTEMGQTYFWQKPHDSPGRISLAINNLPALAGAKVGRAVVLGLRPEHIAVGNPGTNGPANSTISAEALGIEALGADCYVRMNGGAQSFVARASGGSCPAPGERVTTIFDLGQAHFFDPDTGERIP